MVLAALAAAADPELARTTLDEVKTKLRDRYVADPMGSTVSSVLLASLLFYRAERGKNPKVTSYYDALSYIATSLSVGYSDIFPKTAAGKAIGAAMQTVGPAMSANLFEKLGAEEEAAAAAEAGNAAIVERLDAILAAIAARQA